VIAEFSAKNREGVYEVGHAFYLLYFVILMNAVCALKLFTSKIYTKLTRRVFVPTAVDALDFLMIVIFIYFNVYFYNNSRAIN
jgi:hypothetical protein